MANTFSARVALRLLIAARCARLAGAGAVAPLKSGTEVFKNDDVRVWSPDGEVLVASITCKMHLIGPLVGEGLIKALEIAEEKEAVAQYGSTDSGASLGDILGAALKRRSSDDKG